MTFDILSRLPVKLLPRFKCACKAWLGQIENPSFITDHYNKALKSYFRLLVWQIYFQRGKASFHPLLFLVLVGETLDPVENHIALPPSIYQDLPCPPVLLSPCNLLSPRLGWHYFQSKNDDNILNKGDWNFNPRIAKLII